MIPMTLIDISIVLLLVYYTADLWRIAVGVLFISCHYSSFIHTVCPMIVVLEINELSIHYSFLCWLTDFRDGPRKVTLTSFKKIEMHIPMKVIGSNGWDACSMDVWPVKREELSFTINSDDSIIYNKVDLIWCFTNSKIYYFPLVTYSMCRNRHSCNLDDALSVYS